MTIFRFALLLASLAPAMSLANAQQAPAPIVGKAPVTDPYPGFGGVHELNFYVGHSWHAGPTFGYVRNTKYTTVVTRYSYQLRNDKWISLRVAPELTLFANLDEPSPSPSNIHTNVPTRDLGAGLSLANFQGVFLPGRRIQPFVNLDGGLIFYNQPVLSDGGTSFMFTIDYGAGTNIFLSKTNAINVGFRYQHQSNANLGTHNPGTDAELLTIGVSHFFTLHGPKKYNKHWFQPG